MSFLLQLDPELVISLVSQRFPETVNIRTEVTPEERRWLSCTSVAVTSFLTSLIGLSKLVQCNRSSPQHSVNTECLSIELHKKFGECIKVGHEGK